MAALLHIFGYQITCSWKTRNMKISLWKRFLQYLQLKKNTPETTKFAQQFREIFCSVWSKSYRMWWMNKDYQAFLLKIYSFAVDYYKSGRHNKARNLFYLLRYGISFVQHKITVQINWMLPRLTLNQLRKLWFT